MQGHTILVSHCFQLQQRLSGLEGNDSGIPGCAVEQPLVPSQKPGHGCEPADPQSSPPGSCLRVWPFLIRAGLTPDMALGTAVFGRVQFLPCWGEVKHQMPFFPFASRRKEPGWSCCTSSSVNASAALVAGLLKGVVVLDTPHLSELSLNRFSSPALHLFWLLNHGFCLYMQKGLLFGSKWLEMFSVRSL